MLLDPQINANALTWAQDSNKARTETIDDGKGSSLCVGWKKWSNAGTNDHGLRGSLPRGIKALAGMLSRRARPTTDGSARRRNQCNDLEHGSRKRKWTLCEQLLSVA